MAERTKEGERDKEREKEKENEWPEGKGEKYAHLTPLVMNL